jgi:hypothetical protein
MAVICMIEIGILLGAGFGMVAVATFYLCQGRSVGLNIGFIIIGILLIILEQMI